jgi:fucose permease
MFIQAMVINLTPLLFVPLRSQFGLTFEQIGRLVLINCATQVVIDLIFAAGAGRVCVKPLLVAANFSAAIGLVLFAWAPFFLEQPYTGLVVGTVLFSVGCGLMEVLLSPLVQAIPSARKVADMALLHAFAPIGKVVVIVATSLVFHWVGIAAWPWITAAWALVPLANMLAFAALRLPPLAEAEADAALRAGAGARRFSLRRGTTLGVVLLTVLLAGAVEVTLAQWASAYVQTCLGFSPLIADLTGLGLFGLGVIAGRLWLGLRAQPGDVRRLLRVSGWGVLAACVAMGVCPWPSVSLAACALAGLAVSLLWPGVLTLATGRFPLAGAALFGALAAAGDAGAGALSWVAGWLADGTQGGLRMAFLLVGACVLGLLALLTWLERLPAERPA